MKFLLFLAAVAWPIFHDRVVIARSNFQVWRFCKRLKAKVGKSFHRPFGRITIPHSGQRYQKTVDAFRTYFCARSLACWRRPFLQLVDFQIRDLRPMRDEKRPEVERRLAAVRSCSKGLFPRLELCIPRLQASANSRNSTSLLFAGVSMKG